MILHDDLDLLEKYRENDMEELMKVNLFWIVGEAKAAEMLGDAISRNPGYLKLRKLRASGTIAKTVS